MPEQRVYAFADERSLIAVAQATQHFLGTARNHQTRLPAENRAIPTLWLAKANSYYANASIAQFTVRYPNGNKGSEADGDLTTLKAYVRHGVVLSGAEYLLVDVCDGDDAAFEILTPTISVIGKADSAISKGNSGTVSVYSGTTIGSETDTTSNITAYTRFADIASGKWVRAYWNVDSKAWDAEAAEC